MSESSNDSYKVVKYDDFTRRGETVLESQNLTAVMSFMMANYDQDYDILLNDERFAIWRYQTIWMECDTLYQLGY